MPQLSGPSQNPCSDMTAEEEVVCLQCKQTYIYPVILYIDTMYLKIQFFFSFINFSEDVQCLFVLFH